MNELHRASVEGYAVGWQEPRKFKQQRSFAAVEHLALQASACLNAFGRRHLGVYGITAYSNAAGSEPLVLGLRRAVQFRPPGCCARRKRSPHVVVVFPVDEFGLTCLHLLGRS